jgi:hypothetical protein
MLLKKCAPWLWQGAHEVTSSEASAVQRFFSSDNHSLSKKEKKKEAKEKDEYGYLPLHNVAWLAKGKYARSVFRSIFNAYPSAAEEKSSGGYLPLHYVAWRMRDGDGGLEAIQLLLTEYPQAAQEKDNGGDLPIHKICWNSEATLAMVRELLSAHPQSINEKDKKGKKPYALAVAANHLPADAIAYLRRAEQGESVSGVPVTAIHTLSLSLSSSTQRPFHNSSLLLLLLLSYTLSVCALSLSFRRRSHSDTGDGLLAWHGFFFFSPVLYALISGRHKRCARFYHTESRTMK